MATFEQYYDLNPVAVIDQNQWEVRTPEVAMQFRQQPVVFTPLIDWTDETRQTGAATTVATEILDGDVDFDEIPFTANYIDATGIDSRERKYTVTRYGDKVQLHKSSNIFQQWKMSGGRDWRPLLRGVLGRNIVRKFEILARNAYLKGPKSFWTYADGGGSPTDFAGITAADVLQIDVTNEWNLRLGNTGSPVIPGDAASAKLALLPPGSIYDFFAGLAAATTNEAQMWRDSKLYSGQALRYELGEHKNIRFLQTPNDRFGENMSVLYNAGAISKQWGVTSPISAGDGAPDPETTAVDDVWYVGQKDATHYIQMESYTNGDYAVGDIVTIHVTRSAEYGVTNGVDPVAPKTIQRRIVAVDDTNKRLSFDRPVMFNYKSAFIAASQSGGSDATLYAFVTKARHIGMVLVLGSRGGILGSVAKALEFYEPKPIDDFESVWRYVWDAHVGYNIWEPNLFEVHFCAVTLPKAGGLITP